MQIEHKRKNRIFLAVVFFVFMIREKELKHATSCVGLL